MVHEPVRTRDHTEMAMREFGADVEVDRLLITVRAGRSSKAASCACRVICPRPRFLWWPRSLFPSPSCDIHGVGLNPTRSALLDFLV